ncbi:MAG: M48 family metalloprotease [Magnetococcales bacterium]|nr:M48 family metalloprotease [Magnetococcales bacterium]
MPPARIIPFFNAAPQDYTLKDDNLPRPGCYYKSGFFLLPGAESPPKRQANAFFTGFGRFRRIVLFDTLLQGYTSSEPRAILAHEVGHRGRTTRQDPSLRGGITPHRLTCCRRGPE